MNFGQFGVGVVVFVIVVFVFFIGGVNMFEMFVLVDDVDRSIGVDVIEFDVDDVLFEDFDFGIE